MPRSLDVNRLARFEPRAEPTPIQAGRTTLDWASSQPEPDRWPSREPLRDGQISIKAPVDVIERFRRLCRDDRRTYSDMLGILMDGHEGRSGG